MMKKILTPVFLITGLAVLFFYTTKNKEMPIRATQVAHEYKTIPGQEFANEKEALAFVESEIKELSEQPDEKGATLTVNSFYIANPVKVFDILEKQYRAHSDSLNSEIIPLRYMLGIEQLASNPIISERMVAVHVDALQSNHNLVVRLARERLLNHKEEFYSKQAKKTLIKLYPETITLGDRESLIFGVANIRDRKLLKKIRESAEENYTCNYAHMILARMGNSKSIEHCIYVIDSTSDVNIKTKAESMDRYLYIRQPETTRILIRYLDNQKTYPSIDPRHFRELLPAGRDSVTKQESFVPTHDRLIAFHALKILAATLENFPITDNSLRFDVGHSSLIKKGEAYITVTKKWLTENPDFRIIGMSKSVSEMGIASSMSLNTR